MRSPACKREKSTLNVVFWHSTETCNTWKIGPVNVPSCDPILSLADLITSMIFGPNIPLRAKHIDLVQFTIVPSLSISLKLC